MINFMEMNMNTDMNGISSNDEIIIILLCILISRDKTMPF